MGAALLLAACTIAPVRPQAGVRDGTEDVRQLEDYYAAINRRDLLVLPAYVTPDVVWYSIIDGERILEVDSREALVEAFRVYFERFAETRAEIASSIAVGDVIAVVERTRSSDGVTMNRGERVGVFEFENGRIARITYFLPSDTPAH
jgi:ketosteroid isomerase-like protein